MGKEMRLVTFHSERNLVRDRKSLSEIEHRNAANTNPIRRRSETVIETFISPKIPDSGDLKSAKLGYLSDFALRAVMTA